MRVFEIILVIILTIRIINHSVRDQRLRDGLTLAAFGVMALHLGLEGYRWQMLPLYGIALGYTAFALWRLPARSESEPPSRGWGLTLGMLILLIGALLPPVLLPVPKTPAPGGPYPVGTLTVMLVDDSRREFYSDDPTEPRAIMVQVWYPAQTTGGKPAAWIDYADVFGPVMAQYLELPEYFLDHVRYSRSHAYTDAPPRESNAPLPVLLFSHGWNGFRAQNTYQMEELASYGYVVLAPEHTYGSIVTLFPDGQVAYNNPQAMPYDDDLSDEEFRPIANRLIQQWSGDLSFILDVLGSNQLEGTLGELSAQLDLTRVGVLGHSTGGGAIVDFCARDPRCAAGLGMDTYMKPVSDKVIAQGLSQPFLFMFSETWPSESNTLLFDALYTNQAGPGAVLSIAGTAHYDFSDLPAFSPLAHRLGLKGPLNGGRVLEIIRTYSVGFFDEYLRGNKPGPLPEYPEVEFSKKQ